MSSEFVTPYSGSRRSHRMPFTLQTALFLDILSVSLARLYKGTKALTLLPYSSAMSTADYESSDDGHGMREEDAGNWAILLKEEKLAGTTLCTGFLSKFLADLSRLQSFKTK